MNPENKTEFKRLYVSFFAITFFKKNSSSCSCIPFEQNQRGQAKWLDQIERDLHRNFPTHEMFGGAYERIGQAELFRVLKAYSVLNPVDGYCQVRNEDAADDDVMVAVASTAAAPVDDVAAADVKLFLFLLLFLLLLSLYNAGTNTNPFAFPRPWPRWRRCC